jgi:hypothetical protein
VRCTFGPIALVLISLSNVGITFSGPLNVAQSMCSLVLSVVVVAAVFNNMRSKP